MGILEKLYNKWTAIALTLIVILSGLLFFYRMNECPPCLNADEASFAYNAYSILKTGRDEYGKFLPLRLQAFGDNRFPLITYFDIPWIAILGLTEKAANMANFPFVILLPVVSFLLAKELFKNKVAGVLSALFVAFSLGLQSIGRQTHEAYLTVFFLALSTYFFVRFLNRKNQSDFYMFVLFFFIDLFGYHPTRLWAVFYFAVILIAVLVKKVSWKHLLLFSGAVIVFVISDIIYKPTRVASLLFFNNPGFHAKVTELQAEGGSRLIYNKLTIAVKDMGNEYLKYFSPQFLTINGDDNYRFGYPGMSPITAVEYVLLFVGLYFLFKNREKWRFLILGLLLFAPTSAILSWAGVSISRSLFIFIPVSIIGAYGLSQIFSKQKLIFIGILGIYFALLFYNWDFYFNHFPKRLVTIRSWQCGYKELGEYVKTNYDRFDKFYITKKNGQPYIFMLFYLKYPPEEYQKTAKLSDPDEYGFGQVERFDKFEFSLDNVDKSKKSAIIGFPDDFGDLTENEKNEMIKIEVNGEQMFWIKEIEAQP